MNFLYKIIFVLVLFTFPNTTFSQVEYDSTIKVKYDSFYNKLPDDVKRGLLSLADGFNGNMPDSVKNAYNNPFSFYAIFLEQKISCVNKNTHKTITNMNFSNEDNYMLCFAVLDKDTLSIQLNPIYNPGTGYNINNKVKDKYFSSQYYEWNFISANDTSTNTNDNSPERISLKLTARNKIVLSTNKFEVGKIIYGYIDEGTNEYQQKFANQNTSEFTRRISFKYYFRTIIQKAR